MFSFRCKWVSFELTLLFTNTEARFAYSKDAVWVTFNSGYVLGGTLHMTITIHLTYKSTALKMRGQKLQVDIALVKLVSSKIYFPDRAPRLSHYHTSVCKYVDKAIACMYLSIKQNHESVHAPMNQCISSQKLISNEPVLYIPKI